MKLGINKLILKFKIFFDEERILTMNFFDTFQQKKKLVENAGKNLFGVFLR
jgi:hypothetical protein